MSDTIPAPAPFNPESCYPETPLEAWLASPRGREREAQVWYSEGMFLLQLHFVDREGDQQETDYYRGHTIDEAFQSAEDGESIND